MTTDELIIIDKKIEELINDKNEYNFTVLKQKVEEILKNTNIFLIENNLDSKAIDLYLKNVIMKRNKIKKQEEQIKLDNSKEIKYKLIENICKKYEFSNQEELIKKIEKLEKKTNLELKNIFESL